LRPTALVLSLVSTLLLAAATSGSPAGAYDHGDASPEEQYMLELVNRARANPAAEGFRLGLDLDGIDLGLYEVRQPLAMNACLLNAARAHAVDMAQRTFFDHVNPDGRNANGRVIDFSYPLHVDFVEQGAASIEDGNTVENIRIQGPEGAEFAHGALLGSEVHRANIFSKHNENSDEAGVGVREAPGDVFIPGFQFPFLQFYAQEFAHDDDFAPHVLGVAFRDVNGDRFYQIGEEIAGVTVSTDHGGHQTQTAPGGGYGLRIDAPGGYELIASGPGLEEDLRAPFEITDRNVKVDLIQEVEPSFDVHRVIFKINVKKRGKGNADVDSLRLKAAVDTIRLPEELGGLSVGIALGGMSFGPFDLESSGNVGSFKTSPPEQPRISLRLWRRSGKLVFKISRADLMAGLGIEDKTARETKTLDLAVMVGDRFDVVRTLEFRVRSKAGKRALARAP